VDARDAGSAWQLWHDAWMDALFGDAGFFRRPEGPAGHFRTAAHAAPDVLAQALLRLAGEHGRTGIIDVGAGRGELLNALQVAARDTGTPLALHGVEIVERPDGLAPEIGWWQSLDDLSPETLTGALVIAWEMLDTVPCIILEHDDTGVPRLVEVERHSGRERLVPMEDHVDLSFDAILWLVPNWPVDNDPGRRIEVGGPRDEVWRQLVVAAAAGRDVVLLCVDYAHDQESRPPNGSLAGYRGGRLVPPVPDGTCDITAHVAIDSVAGAGEAAGAKTLMLTTQREALRALGVTGRQVPGAPVTAASLERMSREAELIDPHGLGSFAWLLQKV
jgi:SAM-dependent MidA family methyltransferase